MRRFSAVVTLCLAFTANAGSLGNGAWSPSGCGTRPTPPTIESASVSAYNRSITQVNDWQKQIQVYHDCVIKEANSDIAAINQAATAEQARINQASGNVNAELSRNRDKLESSPPTPAPLGGPGGAGAQSYPQY
jgi:hypothetical protein